MNGPVTSHQLETGQLPIIAKKVANKDPMTAYMYGSSVRVGHLLFSGCAQPSKRVCHSNLDQKAAKHLGDKDITLLCNSKEMIFLL